MPTDTRTVDRLPCGMPVDDLLTQVADRTPPRDPDHQRSCRHCTATLAELTAVWQPVHELAAQDVTAPARLLSTVMAQVRALSRSTWHAVVPDGTGRGQTRVAARVVAAVARLAAESVPSVTLAHGGGRAPGPAGDDDATDVVVAGSHVVIDVQVVVDHGVQLVDVARQVRAQIARHITVHTGLTAAQVHVHVVDVRLPRRDAQER